MLSQPSSPRPEIYDETVFKILTDYELARSQRYVTPVTLLRIGLALINPTHAEAESAPAALAAMLNLRLRAADIPARIGNEFAILLPQTNESASRAVCERLLRITLGTQHTPLGFSTRITICIGATSRNGGQPASSSQLMQEAESALKNARARGPQTYHLYSDTALRGR